MSSATNVVSGISEDLPEFQKAAANHDTDRHLPPADIERFRAVHEQCGAGPVRDQDWWELESAALGSDWAGIYALRAQIIKQYEAKALAA